ncbi:MAG: glycosyltransferase family 2 protein [candidate division WS1 bacterium]|nr:glycosyltransferase family 2 protein [candidate division WS1 bacterium]
MLTTADATIIVVSYNKRKYTELCLDSMLRGMPRPSQIVVVDNGSTDGTVPFLEDRFPELAEEAGVDFDLIRNDTNVGACTARNQGLSVACGEYIGFMDNDVAVRSSEWLSILAGVLEEATSNGIVGPKLVFPFEPYNIQHAGAAISRTGRVKYLGRGKQIDAPEHNQRREVQCLISACWLMKGEIPDKIGGLDEIFNPAQFEDFDFCYRAREAGWKVLYDPVAEMYHYESVTTDNSPDVNYKYVTVRNGMEFKRRWRQMFEQEDGPSDEECHWERLETRPIEQTGIPPIVDRDGKPCSP